MFSFWSFFTTRSRFSIILIITIFALGVSSIFAIPKESSPEVDIPIAVVSTVLPGASPDDVEKLVTNVLEEPLKNSLSDVRNITSVSGQGVSSITIEFEASADLEKSIQDVRDEVDAAKNELPDEATDPRIIEIDFGSDPVITATLSANLPAEILFSIGEDTADELEDVRGVSSVSVGGIEKREVTVIVNRSALAQFDLTVTDVARAISGANIALPVGSIEIKGAEFPVRIAGDIQSTAEIESLPIFAVGGSPVYVRDVATVVDGRQEPTTISRTSVDSQPSIESVSFNVFKSESAKITRVSSDVRERLEELQQPGELLEGMQVLIMFDSGEQLQTELTTLSRSGLQTVALVTLVLLLAVGWREALIAAVSIPLSFLTAFIALDATGNTLNFVSLFALILSIGVIVDSTIVIVEGINRRLSQLRAREQEESDTERTQVKAQAALEVVKEFHVPLTAGTLTTVAVFAPLFIVSGVTGEFIKSIPFTIIFVLLASLLVALGFVPLFATKLLHRGSSSTQKFAQKRDKVIARIERSYRELLMQFLTIRERQNLLILTLLLLFVFSLALPVVGAVRVVFFEDSNADFIFAEVELPTGTILEVTDFETRKVEEVLYSIPEAESFVTTVGQTSQFADPFSGASGATRFSNIFINLNTDRDRTTTEILDEIREKVAPITTSQIRVDQLSDGPPSLAPVTVTLTGNSLSDLEGAALMIEALLKDIPGTTDITSTVKDNTNEFVYTVNRDEVIAQGANIAIIAASLRGALFGDDATEIKQLGDDIDIVVRLALNEQTGTDPFKTNETTIDTLAQIQVPTSSGSAPLANFVSVSVEQSRSSIRHKDGERTASVSSRLSEGGNALSISRELENKLESVQLPSSVSVSIGGESEDVDQSFKDMFTALLIGLISMFAILVLQFNSFRYALYVLAIVPLSLIGVFTGLMVTGSPLSFPSIMGFIALSGIVVNNSIILVDTINNERRRSGGSKTLQELIVDASTSRLRPVLLTALTTVIGVVPLLFAAAIWVPLAFAIMFGLAFATIITLLLVPSIYSRWPGKFE